MPLASRFKPPPTFRVRALDGGRINYLDRDPDAFPMKGPKPLVQDDHVVYPETPLLQMLLSRIENGVIVIGCKPSLYNPFHGGSLTSPS